MKRAVDEKSDECMFFSRNITYYNTTIFSYYNNHSINQSIAMSITITMTMKNTHGLKGYIVVFFVILQIIIIKTEAQISCPNKCYDGDNCALAECEDCFFSCPQRSCRQRQSTCSRFCNEMSDCSKEECSGCLFCGSSYTGKCPIVTFEDKTQSIFSRNETFWNQWLHSGKPYFHSGLPVFTDISGDGWLDFFNPMHGDNKLVNSFEQRFELGLANIDKDVSGNINYELQPITDRIICDDIEPCEDYFTDMHGSNIADLDGDGYLDILITNGGGRGEIKNNNFGEQYDNWLFWGEPRIDSDTGETTTIFVGGRDAARAAGVEMRLGRVRFAYLLDVNGDGLLDIFSSQDRRVDNNIVPSILLINQGDRTWRYDDGMSEFSRTMILTDADGDGVAQEFFISRSHCYPQREGPNIDPLNPEYGSYTKDVKTFCNTRPVGTYAIYQFNHASNKMEEVSQKYQNFWAGSKWTQPCCPNGMFNGPGNCHANGLVSGDFDNDQIADHVALYDSKMIFFFSSDRSKGTLPDNAKYIGLEIQLPDYCDSGRGIELVDFDNDGKQEIFVSCSNVGTFLLYSQGATKRDWTLQNGCNGRYALGSINSRFLTLPTHAEMEEFCNVFSLASGNSMPVFEGICDQYEKTGRRSFVQNEGFSLVDINNDGFQDIITIGNFGNLQFFYNQQPPESADNRFISFKLKGDKVATNEYGIGATLVLVCVDIQTKKQSKQFREVSSVQHSTHRYGTKDDRITFGLGSSLKPVAIKITWSTGILHRYTLNDWKFKKTLDPIEIYDYTKYQRWEKFTIKQVVNGTDLCLSISGKKELVEMLPCGNAKARKKKWRVNRNGYIRSDRYRKFCLIPKTIEDNALIGVSKKCNKPWLFTESGQIRLGASPYDIVYDRTDMDNPVRLSPIINPERNLFGSTWIIDDMSPSAAPSSSPSISGKPSAQPSLEFSSRPSSSPSISGEQPSKEPSSHPSGSPSVSGKPSAQPTKEPSSHPSGSPSVSGKPSTQPTKEPSPKPSSSPSGKPSALQSIDFSPKPSNSPSGKPSTQPTKAPSLSPSGNPSGKPSAQPTKDPSPRPSSSPSGKPSAQPTKEPSSHPSSSPSSSPSGKPSAQPTKEPSSHPSSHPSSSPSGKPSAQPTKEPSQRPSSSPSSSPSGKPSAQPTKEPSSHPSSSPTVKPSSEASKEPSSKPSSISSTKNPSSTQRIGFFFGY